MPTRPYTPTPPTPAGYHAPDFQVAAHLTDLTKTLKLIYSHNLTSTSTVGAEVTRKLATSDTTFALAYARKLSNGALTKLKLDGSGALSALYETKLQGGEKVSGGDRPDWAGRARLGLTARVFGAGQCEGRVAGQEPVLYKAAYL